MSRVPFASLVVLGLAVGVLQGAQQPTFRSSVPAVSVYATVVDDSGRLVTDLTADDFEVFDNGRRQPISVFDNSERPISIVVMLDRSGSMRPHFGLVENAARSFVATLLPGDRVRIGSFSDGVRIDPEHFTSDHGELYRIIDRRLLPAGATPLWNAVRDGLDALATEDGQRVLLVFTDGRNTPEFGRNVSFREILGRVRAEESMVYGIGLSYVCSNAADLPRSGPGAGVLLQGGRPIPGTRPPRFPRPPIGIPFPGRGIPPRAPIPDPGRWRRTVDTCRDSGPDPDLRELADVGGGGYFELRSTDNLTSTFERVAHELHSQYLLAFDAPELDGQMHTLDVRVKRRDVIVRARRSYLAAAE